MKLLLIAALAALATETFSLSLKREDSHLQETNDHSNAIDPEPRAPIVKGKGEDNKNQDDDQDSSSSSQSQDLNSQQDGSDDQSHKISSVKNIAHIPYR